MPLNKKNQQIPRKYHNILQFGIYFYGFICDLGCFVKLFSSHLLVQSFHQEIMNTPLNTNNPQMNYILCNNYF